MKPKIWLSSPHMGGNEQNFIDEAFKENWIAPLGPNVTGFEKDLEDYLNSGGMKEGNVQGPFVAALSSGTAALHLALILLGVKRDDDVICQSLTFAASANPIKYLGANPVFVDSEEETLNLSPFYLEQAIKKRLSFGKKIKAIIAVHLYGMPYNVDEIHRIANKYGIAVVEDSAEALGSSYKGKKCGTFGDYNILSFNGNKIITTSGGGALGCNSLSEKKRAIFLATQARDDAPHYQHSVIGYNYRMSNISAGIGRGQMEVLDKHVDNRRSMNFFYGEIFSKVPGVKVMKEPGNDYYSNHWLTTVIIDPEQAGVSSEEIRKLLEKENIESRPIWKPMHLQPVFADAPFYGNGISENAFNMGICLPSGSNLDEKDKLRISKALKAGFKIE